MKKIRPIAVYLPQYHPIPENDRWWGKGFTEWSNVVKGKPKFKNHYQPHLPGDLGFYDLRLPEIRLQQAELAKNYGIYGFCYYHYWFNGKRVLNRPIDEVLQSGEPNFPFMFCWANENWTRAWDGGKSSILLKQEYSDKDYKRHAEFLIPYFLDKRYIKVDDRPVFIIYKDKELPNPVKFSKIFKEVANHHGLDLYLCRFERQFGTREERPNELGFDAGIEFQPLSRTFYKYKKIKKKNHLGKNIINYINKKSVNIINNNIIINYRDYIMYDSIQERPSYLCYPCVSPGWDNSVRRINSSATIFIDSNPRYFGQWIKNKVDSFTIPTVNENFLFINAWNEWAEGNHLEPDQKYGHDYLLSLKNNIA